MFNTAVGKCLNRDLVGSVCKVNDMCLHSQHTHLGSSATTARLEVGTEVSVVVFVI